MPTLPEELQDIHMLTRTLHITKSSRHLQAFTNDLRSLCPLRSGHTSLGILLLGSIKVALCIRRLGREHLLAEALPLCQSCSRGGTGCAPTGTPDVTEAVCSPWDHQRLQVVSLALHAQGPGGMAWMSGCVAVHAWCSALGCRRLLGPHNVLQACRRSTWPVML